jgi:polysaccharide export outer membrane protein
MAGDISTFGDRSKIKVLREINGTTKIREFDIRSKDIINSEFYYIQPNDVIYIQNVNEQFFSVTTFGAALSTVFSTFSFGLFIYNLFTPSTPASN